MTAGLLTYGVLVLVAAITGAVAGGFVAWKFARRESTAELVATEPNADPFIDAEIDQAAVQWAEVNNQPPAAAALMAARLKALHTIGKKKGWLE